MVFTKLKKLFAVSLAAAMTVSSLPVMDLNSLVAQAKETASSEEDKDGVYQVTMDENGYLNGDEDYAANVNTPFSWDNASMYFVITDRFFNGDKSNDHSYGRSTKEKGAENYETRQGTFHGGDLKGLTQKLEDGYFDELGINSIWITAPYEQIHGAMSGDGFKSYAYHGYWTLDFSNMDANMGTEEDLEEFVDTAHEHGIRVVMDVVMNHVGYPDPYTANEYGFGSLASNWEEIYYGWEETKYKWYNDYVGEAQNNGSQGMMNYSGSWKDKWFGTSWVRAVSTRFEGYDGAEQGNDLTICSTGLPDIKTEDTTDHGIPPILKTKWTMENRYDQETKELDEFFKSSGLQRRNVNYVIKWLSDYVREFGIDGFRCDTAKHIELEHWNNLQKQCDKALKEWRKNNPNKAGAQWTDDFWMTGEVYDYSYATGKNDYFSNGFDSLINFAFQGVGGKKGSELESTYSSYADAINNKPGFNVLSYISSHDKKLGARGASSGTALLLCPGGVQIYYGDETARTGAGYANEEQGSRSQMNWGQNPDCLANYQKIGRFRRNHIAVGAGQHNKISDSPYTFSRTYTGTVTVGAEKKTDYSDKVVVSLPGSQGTHDISVGDVFADGTLLVDEYSGEEYTVSGGKVSVTCDSNGVILLAEPTEQEQVAKAKVSASVKAGEYSEDKFDVTFTTENMTEATYTINNLITGKFTEDKAIITIGEDTDYEEETTVTIKGKSTIDDSEVEKSFTYKRSAAPAIGQEGSSSLYVRVKKSDFDAAPLIYVYDGSHQGENSYTGAWDASPAMTEEGDYYVYKNPDITTEVMVIIRQGDWRNAPDQGDPAPVSGSVELVKATKSFESFAVSTGEAPCKVTVKYMDADKDKEIKTITRVGAEGDAYTVYAPQQLSTISGYTLVNGEENEKSGTFTTEEQVITFNYSVTGEVKTPEPATPSPEPTDTDTAATPTPTATVSADVTATATPTVPAETEEPRETASPKPSVEPEPTDLNVSKATATPEVTATVEVQQTATPAAPTASVAPTASAAPTKAPEELTVQLDVEKVSSGNTGMSYAFTAKATGGVESYQYEFVVENAEGEVVYTREFGSAYCEWTAETAGNYTVTVNAKDSTGKKVTQSKKISVSAKTAKLSVKKFTAKRVSRLCYKLTANAGGGTKKYKYKFTYTYKNKTKVIKNYSSTKSLKKAFSKSGRYKLTVYVKDSSGASVKKTISLKIK